MLRTGSALCDEASLSCLLFWRLDLCTKWDYLIESDYRVYQISFNDLLGAYRIRGFWMHDSQVIPRSSVCSVGSFSPSYRFLGHVVEPSTAVSSRYGCQCIPAETSLARRFRVSHPVARNRAPSPGILWRNLLTILEQAKLPMMVIAQRANYHGISIKHPMGGSRETLIVYWNRRTPAKCTMPSHGILGLVVVKEMHIRIMTRELEALSDRK